MVASDLTIFGVYWISPSVSNPIFHNKVKFFFYFLSIRVYINIIILYLVDNMNQNPMYIIDHIGPMP